MVLVCAAAVAEPFVEHLEPPSVCRGKLSRVSIVGDDVDQTTGLWTSLPPGMIQVAGKRDAGPEHAELELRVSAECPLGLYGLRLATEDGLSNLCLIVVDDLQPQVVSSESPIALPIAVSGTLRQANHDRYCVQVAARQRLSFDVIASRLGTDADPLVTIFNAAGRRVVQRDNDPGLFFDCCFEHQFEQAGLYTVEVRDARYQGSPHWKYVLRMGVFPTARLAIPSTVRPGVAAMLKFPELGDHLVDFVAPQDINLAGHFVSVRRSGDEASNWAPVACKNLPTLTEVEPNDLPEQATRTSAAPVVLHGLVDRPGDQDQFALQVNKGDKLVIRAETRPLNSAADVELTLFDSTGREVLRNDDLSLPGGMLDEATLTFNGGTEGVYRLVVREMTHSGGPQYSYRVEVQIQQPRFMLSSEVSAVAVPRGSYQRFPVNVVRTNFSGSIELTLAGAPPGVRLEPTTILEGATGLEARIIAEPSAALGLSTLSIIGRAQAGDVSLTAPVTVRPLVDRQITNVDLIKYALRDNQRWLPPSVTQNIALQILPPAPFMVELDKTVVTLPRYQMAEMQVQTTRESEFAAPIIISATGSQQLGEESQGRRQVFGRYRPATATEPVVTASFHSRSQANEVKERCDLKAVGKHGGRTITLYRSFTLDCRPAFSLVAEPAPAVEPGQTTKVKLGVERLPSFQGAVTLSLAPNPQLVFPESLSIAADQASVEFEVMVAATAKPGKQRIRITAAATVGGFQEEPRPIDAEVEIRPVPKT